MRAVITIEDTDDAIKMGVIYEGTVKDPGFNIGSHAHQHVALIIKVLDEIALKREKTSDVTPVSDEEIRTAFNRVRDIEELRKTGLEIVGDEQPPSIYVPTLSH